MKNIKIIIICMLVISGIIPAAYAYWTDAVNTKISVTLTYDGYLDVLNVPAPIPEVVLEEIPPTSDILGEALQEEVNSDSENPGGIDEDRPRFRMPAGRRPWMMPPPRLPER